MTHVERRELWLERVAAYRASGMSASAWCRENPEVKERQLRTWAQRIKPEESLPVMAMQWLQVCMEDAPVEVTPVASVEAPGVSEAQGLIIRVGEASIEVGRGFDRELLADVVRVLSERC